MHQYIPCGSFSVSCIIVVAINTIKVGRVESATSSQSDESTTEIGNHTNTKVLGFEFLPVHEF